MIDLQAKAAAVAHALGIAIYIRDGWLYQTGPGERIDPPPGSAKPPFHGSITTQAATDTAP